MAAFDIGIVVHGGAGSPAQWSDGCIRAAEAGFRLLEKGEEALEAVLAAAVVLEDDERFNAGTGSTLRLDGATIEMDAAVMDSNGRLGAVAAIQRVKNPVLVARRVAETPHVLLAGQGATAFARHLGFPDYYYVSERARQRHQQTIRALKGQDAEGLPERWREFDLSRFWNFSTPLTEILGAEDTIGAVALDKYGVFAVANSTGGATPMLLGRVGDSPLIGCGLYAGQHAAVATTGIGEDIIRRLLAKTVYDWIASGTDVRDACQFGVSLFPQSMPVGVIAISRDGYAQASNRDMACRALRDDSLER